MNSIGKCVVMLALSLGLASVVNAEMLLGSPGSIAGSVATSEQTQAQGQSQGVTNSGNSGVSDAGNSSISFEDSFNGSDPIRYLPIPTNVTVGTGGGPQVFGTPDYNDRGPHFMSMVVLVNTLNQVNLDEVSANDAGDIEMVQQILDSRNDDEKRNVENKDIRFLLNSGGDVQTTIPGFKVISVNTLKATDDNTINSASLAVRLAEAAKEVGATKIILVSEGTSKKLTSWGVGIGLSYNMAKVGSDHNDQGSVGAGGTGWSYGEGEYITLPYLTAVLGNGPTDLD